MRSSIENKIVTAFLAGLVLMILIGIVSYWSVARLRTTAALVQHTNQVIIRLESTFTTLTTGMTSIRGFAMTADDSFRESYLQSIHKVRDEMIWLRESTDNNPTQQRLLDTAEKLINALVGLSEEIIQIRQGQKSGSMQAIGAQAKSIYEDLRIVISDLQAQENTLLLYRESVAQQNAVTAQMIIVWSNVIAVCFVALALIAIRRDFTGRYRAEAEQREAKHALAQQTRQLEEKNKELETFTYSVSHDLKAPLRGIDGYSRLLLDYNDKLDDDGRKFIDNIRRGTLQMSQLIEDLLSYSRLERREFQRNTVNPKTLVEHLLAERADEIAQHGATVTADVADGSIVADAQGLIMALRNLVDNALKFTRNRPGSAVEISGKMNGNAYLLSVQDNGVGFDMKFHDRIFEIFQRLHQPEAYPGTGVGLAIVRKAVQRMNGRVWAQSELGKGTTFFVEIPT